MNDADMPKWLADRFASFLNGLEVDRLLVEILNFSIHTRTAYIDFLMLNEIDGGIYNYSHMFFGPTEDEKKLLDHIPTQTERS